MVKSGGKEPRIHSGHLVVIVLEVTIRRPYFDSSFETEFGELSSWKLR